MSLEKIKQKRAALASQMKTLAAEQQKMEDAHKREILRALDRCGAFKLPPEVLLGCIQDAVRLYQHNDTASEVIAWQKAGSPFLESKRKKTPQDTPQNHAEA